MEVLRQAPYPLNISYEVPDANTSYFLVIEESDVFSNLVVNEEVVSDAESKITYELPAHLSLYDKTYALSIYENIADERGELVVEDNLQISRPYVDPYSLGHKNNTELLENIRNEALSRAIIDSITGGFYFTTNWMEVTGQGTDYLPLWEKTYKILKVYENAKLVYDNEQDPPALYDWNYLITRDKSAITKDPIYAIGSANRVESKPLKFPFAQSDSITPFDTDDSANAFTYQPGALFGQFTDYLIKVEVGYKVIPYNIKDAMAMLMDDLKCGRMDYHKRYITSYATDQFKIQIDRSSLSGSGNIVVDKILSQYTQQMKTPRVV
jgi:hypothetical protein